MYNLLKLIPIKTLIRMLLDIAKIIAVKTKTKIDDDVIQTLEEVFNIIQPILDKNKK